MTVKEFKLWLQGVMAFQGSEWKPSGKQWSVILEKINQLNEVEVAQHVQEDDKRANELFYQQPTHYQPVGRPVNLQTSGLFAKDTNEIEDVDGYKSPF